MEVEEDTTAKDGELPSKEAKNESSTPSQNNGEKNDVDQAGGKRVSIEMNGGESGKVWRQRYETWLKC